MDTHRTQVNAQALMAASPAYRMKHASPDPNGNRAQRRAWARLTKAKPVPPGAVVEWADGGGA